MACFLVPLAQAIATTACRKQVERKALSNKSEQHLSPFTSHLSTLEMMLWGGSLMLIVDHIINGELTWMFPFFTALETEDGGVVMLREMLTVGVPMSLIVTAVWAIWCLVKGKKQVKVEK